MELLEQGEAVWCLWLWHALASWSTTRIGTAGWHWASCSSLFGLWEKNGFYHTGADREHGMLHAGSRHISVLMSQLTGDNHVLQRWVVQSQGLLGEKAQGNCLTDQLSQLLSWKAACGTLLSPVMYFILSKQLGWLAPGKEGCLSHSHDENCSQERATWQQLPGICDFGKLLTVESGEEVWMNYSISTSLFPLGDPGIIFFLLSLPCWFRKSAACRQGPKHHLKISAHHGDLFTLGPYGASLPRDVFSLMCRVMWHLYADRGLPLSSSGKTDGK